ncbi:MAG: NAD(P)/FAD-dependent oxidoreductase [Inhella sp.]
MSRVAIVGAGVAGSATAIGLARLGVQVTLFESLPDPSPQDPRVGAGLLLQPSGQRVLEYLGLLEPALEHGARLDGLLGDTADGEVVLDMSYHRFHPEAFGLGLQRGVLMGLLWQRLRERGVDWQSGVTVRAFKQDARGVELKGEGGASLGRFDALILADGSFSPLRRLLPVRQRVEPFPWGALWTLLPLPAEFPDIELRQRFRAARQMLGLMPVGRAWQSTQGLADVWPAVNLFWSLPLSELPQDMATLDLAAWKRPLVELLPECEPLLKGLKDPRQLRPARYAHVRLERPHHGCVLALGDCAHGMSPQLGQGANLALVDALVLCQQWREQPRQDWAQRFEHYARRRRAHWNYYSQASRALTPLFQSAQPVLPWLRDRLMGPLGRLGWVHGQNVATLAGLKTGWLFGRLELGANPWAG